jgi:predicted nucleotide-binding protein
LARINPELLARLRNRLSLSRSQVYNRIDQKAREAYLERRLAALALAAEEGINISRYASAEDLAALRQHQRGQSHQAPAPSAPPPLIAPAASRSKRKSRPTARPAPRNTVFVVRGRNQAIAGALHRLLRALGLTPIEWNRAIRLSKKASPHISDILDAGFGNAAAVVVLLTPDDEAILKKEFRKRSDPAYEKKLGGQARPNVLFEAGRAFGQHPNSTVLVQVGVVKPFSDVAGRHIVYLTGSPASRHELVTKLQNAGCAVDTTGEEWLTEGDFRA